MWQSDVVEEEFFIDKHGVKRRKGSAQIAPGNSGNPAGRPKGTLSLTSMIRAKLEELGPDQKRTYAQHLIDNILQDAIDGKDFAWKTVWNYIDGMPKEHQEVEIRLPQPIDDVLKDDSIPEDQKPEETN